MKVIVCENDLPTDITFLPEVAIDTETMGLLPHRDRLCLVQLTFDAETVYLVKFSPNSAYQAPKLKSLLEDPNITKIFHYARFDIGVLKKYLNANTQNVFCTKVASFLARTYSSRHGLKDLVKEYLEIDISKQAQTSDWGSELLSEEQKTYAATDVIYLHQLKKMLTKVLYREDHLEAAEACFKFLPTRVQLDLWGMDGMDIFQHNIYKGS